MTNFQIKVMNKLEQSLIYSIRTLDAITNPELDAITKQRLAEEAKDYIMSMLKGK